MPENVLFVCVENAGRSQMAEAFFRKFASDTFNVSSAGTTPSSQINPIVIQVMKEVGIIMENQQPKMLSDSMINNSFKTVNMGCMDKESCPSLFVKDTVNWDIPDPKEKSLDDVRIIRDKIKLEVQNFIKTLEAKS